MSTPIQNNTEALRGLLEAVNNLPDASVGGGINTSDATATAEDIDYGRTAYARGEMITGTLRTIAKTEDRLKSKDFISSDTELELCSKPFSNKHIVNSDTEICVIVPLSEFGSAKPEDVIKGATFTSASGLQAVGTKEYNGSISLPVLTNPGSASDMASGKELIDGEGKIVTGSLFDVPAGEKLYANNNPALNWRTDGKVETIGTYGVAGSGDGGIVRPGAQFGIRVPAEQYGDATAADVAKGKTFTSASGLKVYGTVETYESGKGMGLTSNVFCNKSGDTPYSISYRHEFTDPMLFQTDSALELQCLVENFGDAKPEDVVAGKTFTSSSGLKVVGTMDVSGATATVFMAEIAPNANTLSAAFSGLSGEPTLFVIEPVETVTSSTTRQISKVTYDGEKTVGSYVYRSSTYAAATITHSETEYSFTYANGTLTVTSNGATTGGYFASGITYRLLYITDALEQGAEQTPEQGGTSGGSSSTVGSATATPSANSLSISFTGLTSEPKMFALTPMAEVALSTSTRYALNVMYDGAATHGVYGYGSGSMMSYTHRGTYTATGYTWTYNNGTLTITATSASDGGYFKSGVEYQLTYAA